MAFAFVVVLVALLSIMLVLRPFRGVWKLGDKVGAPDGPCRICYLMVLCTPAIEGMLGLMAFSLAIGLMLAPDLMQTTPAPVLKRLGELAPQWVYATSFLTVAAGHISSVVVDLPPLRFVALFASMLWWWALTFISLPSWQESLAAAFYGAFTTAAVTALIGFSMERGRGR